MPQEYDVALKMLFRGSAKQVVAELAGGAVTHWLDKELPEIRNTRGDMLGVIESGAIVHLEFQSENYKLMALRMAGYYVDISRTYERHPLQVLIYVGRPKLRMSDRFVSPAMRFRFRMVDIRDLDGTKFLESGAVGDRILAVLMRLRNRTFAIRKILDGIATLKEDERAEALSQLLTIASLRRLEVRIEQEVRKMPVLNSLLENRVLGREFKKGLEQGIEQGLEQGEAKLLRHLVVRRFRKVPKWAEDRIGSATASQLEDWANRLLEAKTLREVFNGD